MGKHKPTGRPIGRPPNKEKLVRQVVQARIESYQMATRDLGYFSRAAWEIVNPSTPLKWNWHHDEMVRHAMAVYNHITDSPGPKIQNLIILVPPGSTKSTTIGVMLLPWMWTRSLNR